MDVEAPPADHKRHGTVDVGGTLLGTDSFVIGGVNALYNASIRQR